MKRSALCLSVATSLLWALNARAQSADLLKGAADAFNRADFNKAIELLQEARKTSADCRIPFYLGLSHYRLQQLDQALVDLASAASCDPKSAEYALALGEAYSSAGDENRALAAYESVLKLDGQNLAALRAATALYVKHDMSDKALPALQKLTSLDQHDANAKADLGAAYAAHNQFPEAERSFRQALSLEPGNVSALVGLGNLAFKTDHSQKAVDVLTKAIGIDARAYEPYVLRGRAYTRLKQYPAALSDLQKALALGATDAEIHYYLSQTYRAMGRESDAQRERNAFKASREESNRAVESQREAARMTPDAKRLVEAGDLPGAIALLEKARNLDPKNGSIPFRLAGLYFENSQTDVAQARIKEAITLSPSQWDYYYLQGLIQKGVGDFGPARASLETAVGLNPSAAEAHNQLGDLAMRRDDFATAVQEFSRAAQLAPQESVYATNLENAKAHTEPRTHN